MGVNSKPWKKIQSLWKSKFAIKSSVINQRITVFNWSWLLLYKFKCRVSYHGVLNGVYLYLENFKAKGNVKARSLKAQTAWARELHVTR